MAKSTINLGTTPNDRTGDTLRDAGSKVNSNFNELYTALGNGTALTIAVTGATSGQVLKFNGTNFVPAADANTDAVTSVNTQTGTVVLTSENITEPANNTVLTGVAIAGTAGQFTCTATTLAVNQTVTITGTLGGTGTITGYTTGTVYTISVTNGTTSFTLTDAGAAIVTTAGTPTGLTYTPSTLNRYFTTARARSSISASGALAYNSTTGALTFTQGNTDTVAEGTTNLYYTAGRFDFRLSQVSTTNLAEGTNLYFTNARARAAISGTGDISYDTGTGVISFTSPVTLTNTVTLTNKTLTSPTLTTPALGVATATSINGLTVTTTTGTLTLVNGSTLVTAGAFSTTLTATATTNVTLPTTGTLATLAGTETLTNKTITAPKIDLINDANGNQILGTSATTSAVDYLVVKNGIGAGVPPHFYADGSSTNIGIHIQPKGTGLLTISDGTDFNKGIRFRSSSSASSAVTLIDAVSTAGRVITLPDATDTLVGRATTDTLSNKTAGVATATSTAASLGYLGIPQNSQAANYTTVIGDAGKHIYVTATSTITIDSNANVAYPIGTTIDFIAATGATVTIAITTDTMYLAGTGTTGSRTLAAFGMATAVKVTATSWFISGYGLT